jgi:hypothetical protein
MSEPHGLKQTGCDLPGVVEGGMSGWSGTEKPGPEREPLG